MFNVDGTSAMLCQLCVMSRIRKEYVIVTIPSTPEGLTVKYFSWKFQCFENWVRSRFQIERIQRTKLLHPCTLHSYILYFTDNIVYLSVSISPTLYFDLSQRPQQWPFWGRDPKITIFYLVFSGLYRILRIPCETKMSGYLYGLRVATSGGITNKDVNAWRTWDDEKNSRNVELLCCIVSIPTKKIVA